MRLTQLVMVTADLDSVRAANIIAALIKRCRTVLTEQGRRGDLLVIPESAHDLAALQDSAVLLTVVTRA